MKPTARQLEDMIFALLQKRDADKTICPSEVARALSSKQWRPLMEEVRNAARKLWKQHKLKVTQRGQAVDPHSAKGAIRLGQP